METKKIKESYKHFADAEHDLAVDVSGNLFLIKKKEYLESYLDSQNRRIFERPRPKLIKTAAEIKKDILENLKKTEKERIDF